MKALFICSRNIMRSPTAMFPALLRDKRLIVLGIPDEYSFMDPELIEVLKRTVEPHLRWNSSAD